MSLPREAAAAAAPLLRLRDEYRSTHPFSEVFPPPYRVILLLSLGVLCWAANIHGLRVLGLKPDELLAASGSGPRLGEEAEDDEDGAAGPAPLPVHATRKHGSEDGQGESGLSLRGSGGSNGVNGSHHVERHWTSYAPRGIYGIAAMLAAWALGHWFFFRLYVSRQGDPSGRHAQAFQGIAVLGVFVAALWPGNVLYKGRRKQFGRSLLPLLLPRPLFFRAPTFPSILLADILTSFAKVFGDVWLTACFLVPRKEHHTWWNGRGSWVVPVLVSYPYAVRLVQCLTEYRYSKGPAAYGGAIKQKSRRPLANALKYASAFPVIWISASQSSRAGAVPDQDEDGGSLWRWWFLSVLVNSLFSFWWDVTNDWGLEVFKPETWTSKEHHQQQRHNQQRRRSSFDGNGVEQRPGGMHRRGLSTWPAPRGAAVNEAVVDEYGEEEGMESGDASFSALLDVPLRSSPSRSHHLHGHSHGHARQPSRLLRRPSEGFPTLFPPTVYQAAILPDLVLRFTWSLKLSPHLAQLVDLESGVFVLEALEILRRCGWVFLRCEWESVKRRRAREVLRGGRVREGVKEVDEVILEGLQR